jgi:hypothetical protein
MSFADDTASDAWARVLFAIRDLSNPSQSLLLLALLTLKTTPQKRINDST